MEMSEEVRPELQREESNPSPLTFADLGIPTSAAVQDNIILGKARSVKDLSKAEWLFVVIAVIGIPSTLGFTIYRIVVSAPSAEHPGMTEDFVLALVLLINISFCVYYVIHGILSERPYELTVLVIATFVVIIYSIINYAVADNYDAIKLTRLIIACSLGPFLIGLGLYISYYYHVSGNLIFRTVGASSVLQSMCKRMYLFYALLTLDMQLGGSMVVLILSVSQVDTEDVIVLSGGVVLTILWFALGYMSVRQENRVGSWMFFGGSAAEPAYIIYKIVKAASTQSSTVLLTVNYICAGMAFLVRFLVIATMVCVYRNFGKGLKEKAYPSHKRYAPISDAKTHRSYGAVGKTYTRSPTDIEQSPDLEDDQPVATQ